MSIRPAALGVCIAGSLLACALPASAQRYTFERTFDVADAAVVDIVTERGRISVTDGDSGRVVIVGTATVRNGWNVPVTAPVIAARVARQPPVEQAGATIRLRPPVDDEARRAVTIAYAVRVPKNVQVRAVSDSGAVSISHVGSPVVVRTQSAAIDLAGLGSSADVTTGSGAVHADGIRGDLRITTSSSAITARDLRAGFRVETGSGAIDALLAGPGDVNVRTRSSAITLSGVRGALTTSSQSGRTIVSGTPGEPWSVSTGSGAVELTIETPAPLTLDASSRSGSVRLEGASVDGSISARRIDGTIAGGGPVVRLASRSGSIHIKATP